MTLAIVVVVVLGMLALAAGIAWTLRDVAIRRMHEEARRDDARHVTAAEDRIAKIEARTLKLEQQAGWGAKR